MMSRQGVACMNEDDSECRFARAYVIMRALPMSKSALANGGSLGKQINVYEDLS
jgi:hypothetical protein